MQSTVQIQCQWTGGLAEVDQLICPTNNIKISLEQARDLSVLIMCDSWRAHCSFRCFFHILCFTKLIQLSSVQIKSTLLKWFLGMDFCRDLTQFSWHMLRWGQLLQYKMEVFLSQLQIIFLLFHNCKLSFCLINLTKATISASLCKETSPLKPHPLMNCYYLQSLYYPCL